MKKNNRTRFIDVSFAPKKAIVISFVLTYLFVILAECGTIPLSREAYSFIALLFIAFSSFRIKFSSNGFFTLALPLLDSLFITLLCQFMLSCDINSLDSITLLANVVLNASLIYLLAFVTNSLKFSILTTNVIIFVFAFIDYLVISFRGSEIKTSDFYSIRTAASVAGQYKIDFTERIVFSIAIFLLSSYLISAIGFSKKEKKSRIVRACAILLLGISLSTLSYCMTNGTNTLQVWSKNGTEKNGLTYNLLIEYRETRVEAPEGYSDEKATDILSRYEKTETVGEKPHIIVIMSEAFSDTRHLGDITLSENPWEFYDSLTENTTKGYALSSVFAGNTAVSEWEFLTGNTQAFLPSSSVAYQQYIHKKANSIVGLLNDEDYTTIAMHPYYKTGWNRERVYDIFGFDEKYFLDELSRDDTLRTFVTDSSLFSDIITRFEEKEEGEKLFTFAVTMQNHGGYTISNFKNEITVDGIDNFAVSQYLTLLKKSDEALEELINYFKEYDEKTMIVLFGDHHPSFSYDFYSHIMGADASSYDGILRMYTVPFMIWTNYDTEEETIPLTSLNFLSTIMLKKGGIGLTPYFNYLDHLYAKVNAISVQGYAENGSDKTTFIAYSWGETRALIDEYRIVQYKNIFNP